MALPTLYLSGTPYAQGVAHGKALKEAVKHNLEVYFERFEREVGLSLTEVLQRGRRYLEAVGRQNPDYYEGVRGIADGSGSDLDALAALNVRYEILYYQFGVNAMADGCTAFAVLPEASANGHLLLGQNWDWIPEVKGAVLHTQGTDGLEVLSFTEAGIFGGKIGLNSAGIGLSINGMTSTEDDWARLHRPFHVRCYEILQQRSFEAALDVVRGEERACSTNFMIAQEPDRVLDLEAAPRHLRALESENGCLVHTNHFLDPDALGISEPPSEKRPHSVQRRQRMTALLHETSPTSLEDLRRLLSDHEGFPQASICRHEDESVAPEERYITVTSALMDLDALELFLSDGPPCQGDYQKFSFTEE